MSAEPLEMVIPDEVGVIEGYRVFRPEREFLRSLNQSYVWEPGTNEALCLSSDKPVKAWKNGSEGRVRVELDQHGRIPSPICNCGFWFYRDPETTWKNYGSPPPQTGTSSSFYLWPMDVGPRLLGKMRGWGRVIEGDQGWRSEFASLVALLTDEPEKYEAIIDRYELAVEPDIKTPELVEADNQKITPSLAEYKAAFAEALRDGHGAQPEPEKKKRGWRRRG